MALPKTTRTPKRPSTLKSLSQNLGIQTPLTCPVCRQEFLGNLPPSAILSDRESDLRPLFSGNIDPLTMLIQVCPQCHFAAYPRTFGHRSDLLDELADQCTGSLGDRPLTLLETIDQEVRVDLKHWLLKEDFSLDLRSPAQRYLQAARCHDYAITDEGSEETALLADYFLRASWAARANGEQHQEFACRAEVIERLWLMADDDSLALLEKVRTLFLLAELSRRQGDFINAIDLFTQLEDFTFDANDHRVEAEVTFFCQQAERLLPLACMKSDINAHLWEGEEDLLDDEEDGENNSSGNDDLI